MNPPPDAKPRFWPTALLWSALLLVGLWLGLYFWVNSAHGQRTIIDAVAAGAPEGRIRADRIKWGPGPTELEIFGLSIVDEAQRPLLYATRAEADIAMSTVLGDAVAVRNIVADGFVLHLEWNDKGKLTLTEALKKPRDPTKPPRRKREPRPMVVDNIELKRGSLTLAWPTFGLQFQYVNAAGRVAASADSGLAIDADLDAQESWAMWQDGERRVDMEQLAINRFVWAGEAFRVGALNLKGHGSDLALEGGMSFGSELGFTAKGDAVLSKHHAGALNATSTPDGLTVSSLDVRLEGGAITGKVGSLAAERVMTGPIQLEQVNLPINSLRFVPGGFATAQGALAIEGARAKRVVAPTGASADDVTVASLTVTRKRKVDAELKGVTTSMLTLPEGPVGKASGEGRFQLGVTKGTLNGGLETEQGKVSADGTVRINPFNGKVTVAVKLAFEAAVKTIADNLTNAVPQDLRDALTRPIGGRATFETSAKRKKPKGAKRKRWVTESAITDAELTGANGTRLIFDGERWERGTAQPTKADESTQ